MRDRLHPRAHGLLDYVTIGVFLLAPWVLSLDGLAAGICFALAAAHLLLTLLTAFPFGATNVVPLPLHGRVELVLGLALLVLAGVLGGRLSGTAVVFFAVMGVLVLGVWLISSYELAPPPEPL